MYKSPQNERYELSPGQRNISDDDNNDDSMQSEQDNQDGDSQGLDDILNSTRVYDSQSLQDSEMNLQQMDVDFKKEPGTAAAVEEVREKSKKELEEEEREKMQVLVSNFTEEQLDRYEMFRRSAFPKAAIKRLMQTYTGSSVSQNAVIAMSGISKVLVGEIVEAALDAMEAQGETGPLQPKHLREAVRRLRIHQKLTIGKPRRRFAI